MGDTFGSGRMRSLVSARLALSLTLCVAGPGAVGAQEPALGQLSFPTSGKPSAQRSFIRGVLYLHSFEYDSAAAQFRAAQRLDPGFAMAYWGEAMTYTHPVWMQQDAAAARAVLARMARTREARRAKAPTDREKRYLDAVEILYGEGGKERRDTLYSREMERLSADFPKDDEARSFFALSLLGLLQHGRDTRNYMRAASLMQDVFARNPRHPGAAHYIIHAFDDPDHAPLGLPAARAYGRIAPGAGHALHMTSHIFVATGMWDDVIEANVAAWKAVNRRDGHYTQWLAYGYLQQGRYREAERFVRDIIAATAAAPSPYNVGYRNLMLAAWLVETEGWNTPLARFALDSVPARELAGGSVSETDALQFAVAWTRLQGTDDVAPARAAGSAIGEHIAAARRGDAQRYIPWVGASDVMATMLDAAVRQREGKVDSALVLARQAAEKDESYPYEFGPPESVKPPREYLGELLLAAKRPHEARAEFERALRKAPNRSRSLLGIARSFAASDDRPMAAVYYARFRANWARGDGGQPEVREAERYLAGSETSAAGRRGAVVSARRTRR